MDPLNLPFQGNNILHTYANTIERDMDKPEYISRSVIC